MSPGAVCPAFLSAILSCNAIPGRVFKSGSLKTAPSSPRYPNVEAFLISLLTKYSSTICSILFTLTLLKNSLD